jgi:dihydrofolate reductase
LSKDAYVCGGMKYKIIVAAGENNEIGAKGDLLWHLPNDMQWFKKHTTGADVIMGRKTYESFPPKFRPLPNRTNIVISRNADFEVPEGVFLVNSLEAAFKVAESCTETEKFIIGGAEIYKQALPFAAELYLTRVHAVFSDADTFFPPINEEEWDLVFEEKHSKDERHHFDYTFLIFRRK